MERRELLARGGAFFGLAALSGCTEERLVEAERKPALLDGVEEEELDLPVEQRLAVAEEAIESAPEELADLEEFEGYLTEADVDVRALSEETEEGEPIASLESTFVQTSERGFMHHLGTVAGGYAALVAGGHESERLTGSLFDADDREFGEYEIRRHWATEYDEDVLTAREYANEVSTTAETV